jgi:hypothetical protein
MADGIISQLRITLEQVSTNPVALSATVTNQSSSPVTILTWNSPLDPLAFQLGVLSITPSGAAGPLDLPVIKLRRQVPPSRDALVTLQTGESRSQTIEIKELLVPRSNLYGDEGVAEVRCVGRWMAVWTKPVDELEASALDELNMHKDAVAGDFTSESVKVSVEG